MYGTSQVKKADKELNNCKGRIGDVPLTMVDRIDHDISSVFLGFNQTASALTPPT
jgi:hypothetical protein